MPDKEELERLLQNRDAVPMDFEPMDFYDSPLHHIVKEITCVIDDGIYKAIVSAGVNVDREKLIQIIQGDRERYEEAYRKGWNDCLHKVMEVAQR